jgi:hypothetical protein
MINFSLVQFYFLIGGLRRYIEYNGGPGSDGPVEEDEAKSLLGMAESFATQLDLAPVQHRIRLIRMDIEYKLITKKGLCVAYKVLLETIEGELAGDFFYHYPRHKLSVLKDAPTEWAATLSAFPAIENEVRAAADCYALGHNRASIYYSMLVLECGLVALAKRIGCKVNQNKSTWGSLITDIQKKIDTKRAAQTRPPSGTPPMSAKMASSTARFLDACEEAATEFRYFASVWRNHIAHARGNYDENDAKKVLDHVRSFMETIATKLRLKERKRK